MITTLRKALALLLCMALCLGIAPAVYAADFGDPEILGVASPYIATVGTVGGRYISEINAAMANGGTVITLTADITANGKIVIEKAVTLDLNGKKLAAEKLDIKSVLSIVDTAGGGDGGHYRGHVRRREPRTLWRHL